MELKQLIYFQKICRCGSISGAAEELFVTQQALSRSLGQLESELNAELLTRSTRKLELTEAGNRLLKAAEHILQEIDELPALVSGQLEPTQKTWHIGFARGLMGSNGGLLSIAALRQAESIFPEIHFQLEEGSSDAIAASLERGELDAAVTVTTLDYEAYRNRKLEAPRIHLIVPKKHPLAGRETGGLSDICNDTIFLPYGVEENLRMVRKMFFDEHIPVPSARQFRTPNCSLFALLDYVYAGEGVTLLSETFVPFMDREKCAVLDLQPEMRLSIRYCYRREHPDAERLDEFGSHLQSICEEFIKELRN